MAFGYAFLYTPIVSLIVYSFNESRLVTVWAGFSTKWYVEQVLQAWKDRVTLVASRTQLRLSLGEHTRSRDDASARHVVPRAHKPQADARPHQ